jgi:preprotein translocase subunit YajC
MDFATGMALLAQQQGGDWRTTLGQWTPIVWMIAIVVIFYFLLIRPTRQRQKAHEEMVKALRPGDRVVTQGGLVGTITKVDEGSNTLRLKLAPSVEVSMLRSHVSAKAGEETS